MAIPLFNSIASWFLKKRIHQIELFIKYPNEVQQEVLQDLLGFAKKTKIGYQYDYSSINRYSEFARRVPIVTYEDLAEEIAAGRQGEDNILWPTPIKWYAKSSGTTNAKSKYIPVSVEALEDCHYKAGKDMLSLYINNNPEAQLFNGKTLRLGGSQELYQNERNAFGDLSAIMTDNLPFWAELNCTPSLKVSLMSEWESKMKAIITESSQENVTGLMGVPSWMLVLLHKLLAQNPGKSLKDIWPNIEVYFHGGVSFRPYRSQYESLLKDHSLQFYEIYNASEGFFAIQDRNGSDELLLMLDYGIFYEFIPLGEDDSAIIPLDQVQLGQRYTLVITTNGGLWRYKIGDVVQFTSLSPYRIQIAGRTKHYINAFGEELVIENADRAIAVAALTCDVEVVDYSVAPIFMEGNKKGSHEWMIEFKKVPKDLMQFQSVLDQELKRLNSDYEAKRYKDMTMVLPKINVAQQGLFYRWLEHKKKLGGQHKVPRLSNDRKLMDSLLEMNV
ncbi:MAG: GH3 auxin-responsive promoter family protein [Flavobacteriaceae bacterium]